MRRFFFGRLGAAMCGDVGALLPGMHQPLAPAANVLCMHPAPFSSMHSQLSAPLPSSALPRSTQRHPPSTRSAIHLPLMAFSPREQISSVNGSRRSSRQSKWTLTPKVAGAGPVPRMRSTVHIAKDLAAQQMRSAAQLLRCGRKRPALWAPYGIPPMDFRFYSIPSRSIAQQGGLSCAACAAAPPTEPLQGPPKA